VGEEKKDIFIGEEKGGRIANTFSTASIIDRCQRFLAWLSIVIYWASEEQPSVGGTHAKYHELYFIIPACCCDSLSAAANRHKIHVSKCQSLG
jgi:hypothetical protein